MNLLNAFILGVVEGITEFLPISSTAHLILTSEWLNIPQSQWQKFFEVFIQSGAILAVLVLYWSYLIKNKKIRLNVLISFIPTAIVGYFLFGIIKNVFFESTQLILWSLALIGLFFIVLEYLVKRKTISLNKTVSAIGWREALMIGTAQAIAVVPGVSRAGIVIVAMMLMGYKRDESAVYSFMLAIPTILAASAFDLFKMRDVIGAVGQLDYLIVGFAASFVTAYFSLRWLINYLKKNSLTFFGIYRILLAIIVMLFLLK